jgi:methionyl-tRNA formyltransferase
MRIVYIGSGEIGVPTLNALLEQNTYEVVGVVTQPDRPAGRQLKLAGSPVKQAVLAKHQNVYQPEKINTEAALEQISQWQPDLIVVCAYGQILKQKLLDIPKLGCLNIHASLLPKYRGSSCIQAAIRNGDAKTGATIMWMDAGLDTGDVLLQRELPISDNDTAETVHDKLALLAPEALLESLKLIVSGQAPRIPQDKALSSYAGKLKKEDERINWHQEPIVIERHIRAMSPWPSAYAWLADESGVKKMLKIHQARICNDAKGIPGTVLQIDEQGVLVAAATGSLWLQEVQAESRKRMPAIEFARGCRLEVGAVLT